VKCDPEVLRKRALDGDPALLEDLFACFRTDVIAFLRRRCSDRTDAEDAMQDTFEAAARYLEGYRGEAALKNWSYRLASSACTRMRRGRKNASDLHVSLDEQRHLQGAAAIGAQAERMLEARLSPLQSALEQLGPKDRAVLLLRDGEGMSTAEVADQLGLTLSAVKSRLHRARAAIKTRLDDGDET
jgi:RNA polymerase sigma-70 factor (ECF subfamily)